MDLLADLTGLEEKLFRNSTRRNKALVESMLMPDFREFGSLGRIYDRAAVIASLAEETPMELRGHDYKLRVLSDDAALLTYSLVKEHEDSDPAIDLRSSLWVRYEGEWRMLFHQGTRVPSLLI